MNRFWIVLTVLFSMNLTTSASVSADNYFFRNGIESYKKGIKHYENKRRNEGDKSFEDSIEFLEEALKRELAPAQENQARLRLGISRYYVGKAERAIESLDSALRQGKLNDKHQAEAHFYWGMSLLAIRKRPEAQKQFEKALKLNSSIEFPSSLEYNNQAKDLLEEARKRVDKTPPTIRLVKPDKDKFEVNQQITIRAEVTDNISVKEVFVHFSPTDKRSLVKKQRFPGTYTRNIWEENARSIWYYLTATDEAGNKSRYPKTGKLKITVVEPPSDKTPPTIRLIKPHDGAPFKVNQPITVRAEVTDNTSKEIRVSVSYGFSKSSSLEPSHYSYKPFTKIAPGKYIYILLESQTGYIWYHLIATDEAGNESRYPKTGELKITVVAPPSDKTPPTIRLVKPDKDKFEVNQQITIAAEVTDDTSVEQVRLAYGFSQSNSSEPLRYSYKPFTKIAPGKYIYILLESQTGYIWYHLIATDEAGNESRYPKTGELKITVRREEPEHPLRREEPEHPLHREIWANYAWSNDVFKNDPSVFDWGRGDVLSLAYLCKVTNRWTLGPRLDFSYQNPAKYDNSLLMRKVLNASVTGQFEYDLGKGIALMLLPGVAGYRSSDSDRLETRQVTSDTSEGATYITPILGMGLKYYLLDRVTIDAAGSIKLLPVDTLADGESSFAMRYFYHGEVGIRVYITRKLNLRVGYGRWYLGDRSTTGVQIGLGVNF